MKITFLGTAGSFVSKSRTNPSILIENSVLLDCGEGTTQKLQILNSIDDIKLICLSHLHNDHFMGLFSLLWYYWINKREEPITIIGPPNSEFTINRILELCNTPRDMKSCELNFIELNKSTHKLLIMKNLEVEAFKVEHKIPTYGYRIKYGNKVILYSGDSKPTQTLNYFAHGSDLLIGESTFPDDHNDFAHNYFHLTPSDLIEIAKNSECQKIAVVHISPIFQDSIKDMIIKAEDQFNGKVFFPNDMDEIQI